MNKIHLGHIFNLLGYLFYPDNPLPAIFVISSLTKYI